MVPLEIREFRNQPRRLLMKIEGVHDREAAKAFAGKKLWIKKSDLPQLADDAYYWFDLIGMTVVTVEGETLGRLENILPTGSNDVYVVQNDAGRETLVPALDSVVLEVNLGSGRMVVDLPEGL